MESMSELIGYVAGALTTVAFVPQVWKLYRSKSARDISIPTFALFGVGVSCWFVHGVMERSGPMMVWNGVTLILALAVVGLTVRYRSSSR